MQKAFCVIVITFTLHCCSTVTLGVIFEGDLITKRYASLAEARADHLFEKGWLPDILPPSSVDIRTSNNLDLDVSTGEFSFEPAQYASFAARLTPYQTMPSPFADFEADVAAKEGRGFQARCFVEQGYVWVFLCVAEDGYCEYAMWRQKGPAA